VQRVLPITPETNHQISYPEVRNVSVGTKTVSMTEIPLNKSTVEKSDKIIDANIENTQKHFLGVLEGRAGDVTKMTNSNSSITSAMQILKEGEQQWLNSEVNPI
jgi:hypothetical protein